ncbi:MAG TPA: tripartite tricarboxylate transporter substrate binding protein [Acetobacteraceae bacterium]|nr:tripartite tricarboxylate transporter substrate binding protein [Acetobacteraceae bacterium]
MLARRHVAYCLAALSPIPLGAQEARWPTRPVRIVVPYQPGGQSDTVMRLMQPRMAEFLGQPVVVENRSGAGGTVGAGVVAMAPADGYTFLVDSAAFLIVPFAVRGLTFDHEATFVPVGMVVEQPYVLAVSARFPARDLAGFIEIARRQEVSYGSPGHGGVGHLAGALLAQRAGIRLEHVPYRGGSDVARDLAAGTLQAAILSTNSLDPVLQDRRAVPIALTSGERRGGPPGVPTIAELGFPGFDIPSWNAVFARAGTPAAVIARMAQALNYATEAEAVREGLQRIGSVVVRADPDAAASRLQRDRALFRDVIQQTGIVFN